MENLYPIYEIEYSTHSVSPLYAIVSEENPEKAGKLLENSLPKKIFDKIYNIEDTKFKANKKGVIFPKL